MFFDRIPKEGSMDEHKEHTTNKWLQIEQDVNRSLSIEWMLIPPRDKLVGRGFELWSGFAHNIGRTHKACVYLQDKEEFVSKGMFKFDIDSQGRSVLISYTGEKWGNTVFDEYRPEIHRLLSGTWIEGRWEHTTYETGLNYRPTIVGKGNVIYDMCMYILDEMVEILDTGKISVKDDYGKYFDILEAIPPIKNHEGLLKESENFHSIIGSQIPVLPPQLAFHHYHAIPVRVQNGCGGGCTFCDFYVNRKIEILQQEAVFNQIDQMAECLGEEVDHCDQLVLLDGDALTVPTEQLGAELQYARDKFLPTVGDVAKPKNIAHAFVKATTVIG